MIKNKNREELIEMVYTLDSENQSLSACSNEQHDIIKAVSDVYNTEGNFLQRMGNAITLPFRLNKQLNKHSDYFYTYKLNKFNIMNEEQLLEALDYINDLENQKVSPILYMDYIQRVTGIKVCKSCGSTNKRIHNDFQRRILNTMKNNYPHLAMPIELTSGRYGSEHFTKTIPYYTYIHLYNLKTKISKDLIGYRKRGLTVAINELEADLVILSEYINKRKNSSLQDVKEDVLIEKELPTLEVEAVEPIEIVEKVAEEPIKEVVEATKKTTRTKRKAKTNKGKQTK